MKIFRPTYYDQFRCLAADCPDSCCKDWEVLVDPESTKRYLDLSGGLGDMLRHVLVSTESGESYMSIENGHCPMWRSDHLCRIQAELGHGALCKTCREFPRLTHDYGSFIELGLELSCPEAARLLLNTENHDMLVTEISGSSSDNYDTEIMDILLQSRKEALSILDSTTHSVPETLALLLMYSYHVQAVIDGSEWSHFDREAALLEAHNFAKLTDFAILPSLFMDLEILTDTWRKRLTLPLTPTPWSLEYRNLARYFVHRYWLQTISDYDLVCRVKFLVASCLLIHLLGGDLANTAQLFSKEIENNIDNVEFLLDSAYSNCALTDAHLLGWLFS